MNLKKGVSLRRLKPQTLFAMFVAEQVYNLHAHSLTVTSANDSEHMEGSLHYEGKAFDCRIRSPITGVRYFRDDEQVAQEIRNRIGPDYDVLVYDTHFHIEWDPR